MTLDELLLEWSYKSEKGYPSLDSPSDVLILEEILDKLDLPTYSIIKQLKEQNNETPEEEIENTVDTDGDGIPDSPGGDSQYDAVIRNHLGLSDDQPIPKPKHKYPFSPSGGTFSIQVKGDDLKYWQDFWTLTPPKAGAEQQVKVQEMEKYHYIGYINIRIQV